MGNGDGGTGVASAKVLKALVPVLIPEVTIVPTQSCVPVPPAPVPTPVAAVTARPAFTG